MTFIVSESVENFEFDEVNSKNIGVADTYDKAMEIFKKEESKILGEKYKAEIINDYQPNDYGDNRVYEIDYQSSSRNITLKIEKFD